MGRKDAAREIAVAAGVPVVPRADSDGSTGARSPTVGFPVLVKAAAGGGGKGMRIVRSADELDDAVAAAQARGRVRVRRRHDPGREVRRARPPHRGAGAGRRPRQRRAPVRARLLRPAPPPEGARGGAGADDLAEVRTLGHSSRPSRWPRRSATRTPAPSSSCVDAETDEVFFLEMNTRLQVEHPVTELVDRASTWSSCSSRVAAGEPLPFARTTSPCSGHAIEARVYAEDPFGGFLPQAGTAPASSRWPAARPRRRRAGDRAGRRARRTTRCSAR